MISFSIFDSIFRPCLVKRRVYSRRVYTLNRLSQKRTFVVRTSDWLGALGHGASIGQTQLHLSLLSRESRAAACPSSSGAAWQRSQVLVAVLRKGSLEFGMPSHHLSREMPAPITHHKKILVESFGSITPPRWIPNSTMDERAIMCHIIDCLIFSWGLRRLHEEGARSLPSFVFANQISKQLLLIIILQIHRLSSSLSQQQHQRHHIPCQSTNDSLLPTIVPKGETTKQAKKQRANNKEIKNVSEITKFQTH